MNTQYQFMVPINNNRMRSMNVWSLLIIDFTKIKPKGVSKQKYYSSTLLLKHNNTYV